MRKQALHPRTAIVNAKQKNQTKIARQNALRWLADTFPEAFDNQQQIRPLKIGILQDLMLHAEQAEAQGISKGKLREALVIFTRRIDYLICLKAQEMRIDLYGQPTQPVTADEAERAVLKIKKRIEKTTKNTKKTTVPNKTSSQPASNPLPNSYIKQVHAFSSSIYPPLRAHTGGTVQTTTPTTRNPAITIRNKSTKPYDPSVVARLKEKLGLSKKSEETIE